MRILLQLASSVCKKGQHQWLTVGNSSLYSVQFQSPSSTHTYTLEIDLPSWKASHLYDYDAVHSKRVLANTSRVALFVKLSILQESQGSRLNSPNLASCSLARHWRARSNSLTINYTSLLQGEFYRPESSHVIKWKFSQHCVLALRTSKDAIKKTARLCGGCLLHLI